MDINFNILDTIKNFEPNHMLNILILNENLTINVQDLISLNNYDYGNITVVVSTPLQSSQLIGKVNGLNIKVVLSRRIPIISYDLIISNSPTDLLYLLLSNLTVKYLYILNNIVD